MVYESVVATFQMLKIPASSLIFEGYSIVALPLLSLCFRSKVGFP